MLFVALWNLLCTIRYDTRCYFNACSKADMSQLNRLHGNQQLNSGNRKTEHCWPYILANEIKLKNKHFVYMCVYMNLLYVFFMFFLTVCVVAFFQWHFIDLFSCIAASLFSKLTYLLTYLVCCSSNFLSCSLLALHSSFWLLLFWSSVLWRRWLGCRKGIRPIKKLSGGVLVWLSVWS